MQEKRPHHPHDKFLYIYSDIESVTSHMILKIQFRCFHSSVRKLNRTVTDLQTAVHIQKLASMYKYISKWHDHVVHLYNRTSFNFKTIVNLNTGGYKLLKFGNSYVVRMQRDTAQEKLFLSSVTSCNSVSFGYLCIMVKRDVSWSYFERFLSHELTLCKVLTL